MARTRNIKPGFFTNDTLGECEPLARLFFAGLWCHADREGRLEWRPKKLKAEILPYDNCDVDAFMADLEKRGFVARYEAGGTLFVQIVNFGKHQNPHHMETPSVIPAPEGEENKFNHTPISPKQRARIYARDGHKCIQCGSAEKLQIDHIVMVCEGGTSDDDNLRTLCAQCNNKRSKRPVNSLNPSILKPSTLKLSSEAIASAPAALEKPMRPLDLDKAYWETGKSFLEANGVLPTRSGGLLGRWRRDYGRESVVAALAKAEAESPSEIVSFIEGCLRKSNGKRLGPATGIAAGFAEALRAGEGEPHEDRRSHQPPDEPLLDGQRGSSSPQGPGRGLARRPR